MRTINYHVFQGNLDDGSEAYMAVPREEKARSFTEPHNQEGLDNLAESLAMQAVLRRYVLIEMHRTGEGVPAEKPLLTVSFRLPYDIVTAHPEIDGGYSIAAKKLDPKDQQWFQRKYLEAYARMKNDPEYSPEGRSRLEAALSEATDHLLDLESPLKLRIVSPEPKQ